MSKEIHIPTSEQLKEHHDKVWAELPEELQQRIIATAKIVLGRVNNLSELREHINTRPLNWAAQIHFGWGMWFRNQMRKEGLPDEVFPHQEYHWDDYYVKAVEEALKEIPE